MNSDFNSDKENRLVKKDERQDAMLLTTLSTTKKYPERGQNFFAFGDGNGSWIEILKQLYTMGIVVLKSETDDFSSLIKEMENAEQQVKDFFKSKGINDSTENLSLDQIPHDTDKFDYLSDLSGFLDKFECSKVDNDLIEVLLIGDLLNDRFTNNYGMLILLAKFTNQINFKITHSNHDYQAIKLFNILSSLYEQFLKNNKGKEFSVSDIDQQILLPLLNEVNSIIRGLIGYTADKTKLTGVHYGFSSITWFYALRSKVYKANTIQPILSLLEMIHGYYYPKVSLVIGRTLGTNKSSKFTVFTHATCILDCPNLMNGKDIENFFQYYLRNDQALGGRLQNDLLNKTFKDKSTRDKLLYATKNKLSGLYVYLYNELLRLVNHPNNRDNDKEQLLAKIDYVKQVYEFNKQKYLKLQANRETTQIPAHELIQTVKNMVSSINQLEQIFKEKRWIEYLLIQPTILQFTQSRVLYKNPFSKYVTHIHGHIGYNSFEKYHDDKIGAVNIDSNGIFNSNDPHRPHSQERRIIVAKANKSENQEAYTQGVDDKLLIKFSPEAFKKRNNNGSLKRTSAHTNLGSMFDQDSKNSSPKKAKTQAVTPKQNI